jgi:hypothetical protein
MDDRLKLVGLLGCFVFLGAAVVVLSIAESHWPTPAIVTIAGAAYHFFPAYALFLGAAVLATKMPVRNWTFATFIIMVAALAAL